MHSRKGAGRTHTADAGNGTAAEDTGAGTGRCAEQIGWSGEGEGAINGKQRFGNLLSTG